MRRARGTGSPGAENPLVRSYALERLVASSDMSRLYSGWRRWDRRHVAIKLLLYPESQRARLRECMLHEAYMLTLAANPLLVELLDYGQTAEGAPYLVLEWLPGADLGRILAVEQRLTLARACDLFARLLDAVESLHARGVVHADLKPENLMISRDPDGHETVCLMDLGAACLAGGRWPCSREVLGTPGYIAPEVIQGEPLRFSSDIFAAGVVLKELLARAESTAPLETFVATACASTPGRRFRDVAEARAAFTSATGSDGVAVAPRTPESPTARLRRPSPA